MKTCSASACPIINTIFENRIYILLGDTQEFINKEIIALYNIIQYYYIYQVTVKDNYLMESFLYSNVSSLANYFNIRLCTAYNNTIGSCFLKTAIEPPICVNNEHIFIHVLCCKDKHQLLKTLTFITLTGISNIPDNIMIDGYKIDDASFFYSNPAIIKTIVKDNSLYNNLFLRSELNRLIYNVETQSRQESDLLLILTKIIFVDNKDFKYIVIEDKLLGTQTINKLINFNHTRETFAIFVKAWYFKQMNNSTADNEKLLTQYNTILPYI